MLLILSPRNEDLFLSGFMVINIKVYKLRPILSRRNEIMSVFEQVDLLMVRAQGNIPQRGRREKLQIYAEGLKAKVRQTEFALSTLSEYNNQTDAVTTSTSGDEFLIQDKVYFYCDTFWTFLYSSLDVLGQTVNQALKLKLKERKVSFKTIVDHLCQTQNGQDVQKRFSQCARSKAFKNLDAYRNCSVHRRQICIEEERRRTSMMGGYSTGPGISVERFLCDNPLDMKPRTKQKRKIPDYMMEIRNKVHKQIENIIKAIEPVR